MGWNGLLMGLLIFGLNCAQMAGEAESDFGLKINALTNSQFGAELFFFFRYQCFLCVVSTASCVLLAMAKRFGHFDLPKVG